MKKKILIILSIAIIVIAGIFAFNSYNKKLEKQKLNEALTEVERLLNRREYDNAYKIIKDNNLLSKEKDFIISILTKEEEQYKINNVSELIEINSEKWNNIESLNKIITDLNFMSDYLKELLKIKVEEEQYFPALKWYSKGYETYSDFTQLAGSDEFNFRYCASALQGYSFEDYGTDNIFITDLNNVRLALAEDYLNAANALKNANYNQLKIYINKLVEERNTEFNIITRIIEKNDNVVDKVKNLPMTGIK